MQPAGDIPDTATWYVDGSLIDGPSKLLSLAGYSIVVVAQDGRLLGCAHGAPPSWVTTAGAAEAYALYKVLTLNPFVPRILTDCLGVLHSLQRGSAEATAANKVNAKLWTLIGSCLDGTSWQMAADNVTWMPAHGTKATIGRAMRSDGRPITATDWRGNRLADALAKAAASRFRTPYKVRHTVATAMRAYEQAAALAGMVTHAANNHFVSSVAQDGKYMHKKMRDAMPPARMQRPLTSEAQRCQPPTAPATTAASTPAPPATDAGPKRDHSAKTALNLAAAQRDARFLQAWHRDMASRPRAVAAGMSARERLEALRLRVRLKEAADRTQFFNA